MSEWLYTRLLQLYPAHFRERYADEMSRLFRDRLRHENPVRVWMDVLTDALVSIPGQHGIAHPYIPPSAAWMMPRRAAPAAMLMGFGAALLIVLGFLFSGLGAIPVAGVGVLLLFFIACYCGRRQDLRIARSRADVGDETVTVRYEGLAPLTLQRRDVVGLHDYPKLGLRICTVDAARDLWVPARSESYPRIKTLLSDWAPVQIVRHVPALLNPSSPAHTIMVYAVILLGPLQMGAVLLVVASTYLTGLWERGGGARRWLRLGPAAILAVRWWWR